MITLRHALRTMIGLLAVSGLALVGGFFVFASTLPRAGSAQLERISDIAVDDRGIIVLTGGAGQRIAEGLDLHAQGLAQRVLISGVHPGTRKADLATATTRAAFDCCVDLGDWARTTSDNAVEGQAWLEAHDFKAAIVVTSDFHLPRALTELRRRSPDVVFVGVPVASRSAPEHGWMAEQTSWRVLATEYLKFLVVRLRSIF